MMPRLVQPMRVLSPESRVLEALEDHTLLEVIAAAADVPLPLTLLILERLQRQGLAERYSAGCWGPR